jgi:hypothetical protein
MDELINVKGGAYKEYETLIQKRDELKKEAFCYQRKYTREFGDLIVRVFEKKIECIRKKKMIEYCQMAKNHGLLVDQEELQKYLDQELAVLQMQLDDMIEDAKAANVFKILSKKESTEIKRIYRRIAKRIHPDMNSFVQDNEKLLDLWQRVVIAYKCNDLKELQEAEVLINMVLSDMDEPMPGIFILNIEEKIEELTSEINEIQTTKPYTYKYLLMDEEKKNEKRLALSDEYQEYKEYEKQLEVMMEDVMKQGVTYVWQMK